jgi:glycosyltransferase involved in cell wall biosynthesis
MVTRIAATMKENGIGEDDRIVLHVHDPYLLGLAGRLAKRFPRSRIVYDRHEYYETWRNRLGFSVPGLFERMYGDKVSEIVFVSRAVPLLPKVFSGKTVTVIPNYPESKRFDVGTVEDKLVRFENDGEIIAVYFGVLNLNFDRDTELMFDVMRSVLRAKEDVSFEVAGRIFDPAIEAIMNGMSAEFGERMRYLGEIPYSEVVRRTQKAHIGFFLLRPESPIWSDDRPVSPNKVYEFLMSGTIPLIKANLDDRREMEGCALFFEKNDGEKEIVDALLELFSDRKSMLSMMKRCQETAPNFSWEKVSRGYLECYERLFTSMRFL